MGFTRVDLFPTNTAASIPTALRQAAKSAGLTGDCYFAWGDLRLAPVGSRRTLLSLGEGAPIEGRILCGRTAIQALTKDQRLHQMAFCRWSDGQLWASHPSGPGSNKVDLDEMIRRRDPEREVFVRFSLDPHETKVTATALRPVMERLVRAVLFALWPLPE